ncbi:competence type IV pilus minor pilin ComGE [Streptococcus sp. DD12]|uniref:competence type IV pilus minor pilin ComGE n=1 Tax=Streptococcus sp. DD12 TaxID=1777880 RepID=UPI000796180D|nr:competence type IV pilus minor pilin ComGE [Streptococcus sp. DD12]KXT75387.1 hypothetical protein STRDD12_01508 [Streptococcus sp. DD12]
MESLVGLAIFAGVVTLLLSTTQAQVRQRSANRTRQEAFLVAQMAVQTKQETLTLNGQTVQVERTPTSMRLLVQGEELVYVYQVP